MLLKGGSKQDLFNSQAIANIVLKSFWNGSFPLYFEILQQLLTHTCTQTYSLMQPEMKFPSQTSRHQNQQSRTGGKAKEDCGKGDEKMKSTRRVEGESTNSRKRN